MYNDEIRNILIDNLENKVIGIVNTNIALVSQGYLVNNTKHIRLRWSSILIHAFENIDILSVEQQNKIDNLYNKLMEI